MLEKMFSIHYMFTIPKVAQENLLITLTCLVNRRITNLITHVPRPLLFVEKGGHLILVLFCKANLERKEISASDWLKPRISMLLTLVFYVLHSRFGFALQEAHLWR